MPRVTEGYRLARREEIADAMLRCMSSVGYSRLSMPDVFAESGLSAGSVYSHFATKTEIGIYVAHRAHQVFVEDLESLQDPDRVIAPPDLCRWLLERLSGRQQGFPALVQFWAESTTDSPIRTALRDDVAAGIETLADTLMPWATAQATAEEDPRSAARRAVEGILVLSSGFISRGALFGSTDVAHFLEAVETVLPRP